MGAAGEAERHRLQTQVAELELGGLNHNKAMWDVEELVTQLEERESQVVQLQAQVARLEAAEKSSGFALSGAAEQVCAMQQKLIMVYNPAELSMHSCQYFLCQHALGRWRRS